MRAVAGWFAARLEADRRLLRGIRDRKWGESALPDQSELHPTGEESPSGTDEAVVDGGNQVEEDVFGHGGIIIDDF